MSSMAAIVRVLKPHPKSTNEILRRFFTIKHEKHKPWEDINSDSWLDQQIWHQQSWHFLKETIMRRTYFPAEIQHTNSKHLFQYVWAPVMFGIGFDLKTCMVYVVCSGHLMFNAAKADHVIIRVWKLRGCNHSSQSSTGLSQNTFCGSGWILAVKYYMHINAHITYLLIHRLSQTYCIDISNIVQYAYEILHHNIDPYKWDMIIKLSIQPAAFYKLDFFCMIPTFHRDILLSSAES